MKEMKVGEIFCWFFTLECYTLACFFDVYIFSVDGTWGLGMVKYGSSAAAPRGKEEPYYKYCMHIYIILESRRRQHHHFTI